MLEKLLKQVLAGRGVAAERSAEIAAGFGEVLLKHWPALVDESGSFSTSTLASRITKTMNLMGGRRGDRQQRRLGRRGAVLGRRHAALGRLRHDDLRQRPAFDEPAAVRSHVDHEYPGHRRQSAGPLRRGRPAALLPGEGVGVLLLKRLSDARRDGDRIHGIIRGIGAGALASDSKSRCTWPWSERCQTPASSRPTWPLIEMDGTGLPESDQEEVRAVLVGLWPARSVRIRCCSARSPARSATRSAPRRWRR